MDLSFDEFPEAPTHQLPTAISSLIAGAVATFEVPEIRSFLFSPAKYCRRPPPAPAR